MKSCPLPVITTAAEVRVLYFRCRVWLAATTLPLRFARAFLEWYCSVPGSTERDKVTLSLWPSTWVSERETIALSYLAQPCQVCFSQCTLNWTGIGLVNVVEQAQQVFERHVPCECFGTGGGVNVYRSDPTSTVHGAT